MKNRCSSDRRIIKINLLGEASFLAPQSSTQLHAAFRKEYDASAEKDEFHKVRVEEKMEYKRRLYIQEAGEELRGREDAHGRLLHFMKRLTLRDNDCKIKNHICPKKLHRVVHLQKQLGEVSKQCQEETKSLSRETTMLRRELHESN